MCSKSRDSKTTSVIDWGEKQEEGGIASLRWPKRKSSSWERRPMTKEEKGMKSFEEEWDAFIEQKIREDEEDIHTGICEAAQELLDKGIPIYYGDDQYPGKTIKEYPDGRREIVTIDKQGQELMLEKL
jgi:hypothetical protein